MDQLMWAADVKVNGKKIRAEYTDEATFRCEDEDVTSAYNRAVLWNDTYSRPINQAIGSVLVERDDAVSVAALLFQVLSGKGIEDFTLYGSGYIIPNEPLDPDMTYLDTVEIDQTNMVAQLPESKFGFTTPALKNAAVNNYLDLA